MRKAAQLISCRECPRLQFCWELLADNTVNNENWPTDHEPELSYEDRGLSGLLRQDQDIEENKSLRGKLIAYICNGVRCNPPEE